MNLRKRTLGRTGLEVTELGFGALEIGRDWAADVDPQPGHLTLEQAGRLLNDLLDRGIDFIDTAPAYWFSEEYIGRAISHRRSEFILATKVGEHCDRDGSYYDYSGSACSEFIDRSLQRMHTDVIDLIQIHSASIETLEKGDAWQALDTARRAGKVRYIGMTGQVDACKRAVELGGYDTIQVPFNLLAPDAAAELFPMCMQQNIGVIIMRGLASGKLTPKFQNLQDPGLKSQVQHLDQQARLLYGEDEQSLVRAALRYVMSEPAVSTAIIGTRRMDAIEANLAMLNEPISEEEASALKKLAGSGNNAG